MEPQRIRIRKLAEIGDNAMLQAGVVCTPSGGNVMLQAGVVCTPSNEKLDDNDVVQAGVVCTPSWGNVMLQAGVVCTPSIEKLDQLSGKQSKGMIYRVHRNLRNVNPKAYEPEVVAIGPYHRNKEHLKNMEDRKSRNLQLIRERIGCDVDQIYKEVANLESEARKCYADQRIGRNPNEFVHMLVLDGCFIIELVQNFALKENDPIFQMLWMKFSLQYDLLLFENQIPFFILCKLFDFIKDPEQGVPLPCLILDFFSKFYPGKKNVEGEAKEVVATQEIKHILDLIHRSWFRGSDLDRTNGGSRNSSLCVQNLVPVDAAACGGNTYFGGGGSPVRTAASTRTHLDPLLDKKMGPLEFMDCASGLTEANVKFQKNEEATLFDIRFEDGVMHMAPLVIDDGTEILWRNLIAYEQYSGNNQPNLVTDYVIFLDNLINSAKDVVVLKEHEIITTMLGDDEVVAKMVNKLCKSVIWPPDRFFYSETCKKVKDHCKKRRNRWVAKLRRNYLNSPWSIISVIAAAVLLLLTVAQTVFSILQVV